MSSETPTRSEVMTWTSDQLASFFSRRRDMAGCDKAILRSKITGQRFLNMTENDLQKFPKVHVPLVSKISQEINKNTGKTAFFRGRPTVPRPKYDEPAIEQHDPVGWDPQDFEESEDENDYESPDSNGGSDYESPTDGHEEPELGDSDYEPPPSEKEVHQICPAKPIGESDYIGDNRMRGFTSGQPPVPPERPGLVLTPAPGPAMPFSRPLAPPKTPENSSQRPSCRPPNNGPPGSTAPFVDRTKKPSTLERPAQVTKRVPAGNFSQEESKPMAPFSSNTFPLNRKHSPRPSSRGPPTERTPLGGPAMGAGSRTLPPQFPAVNDSWRHTPQRMPNSTQGMNPEWYIGQVTREQAESRLKRINMDGAFLVRDGSKGSPAQPFTLMVLYQEKVYNIQIRYDSTQQTYLLGTGLKSTETFSNVEEIIENYKHLPLLLIDAKNRGSGQQNQCSLIHPAGL